MPDYRAAWGKASEREYEIMRRMAADSHRDMSQFLTPDSIFFTVARAVYSFKEEFGDLLKYRSYPFPNPRLSALQMPPGGIRYDDKDGGTLLSYPEPTAREVHDILGPGRISIEFDLMEPGDPQFARARARFDRMQTDYAEKCNFSDLLKAKKSARRQKALWPRYLRVLDARSEGAGYQEIGIELKHLYEPTSDMSQKQADARFGKIERAKSDAKKWHTAALQVANYGFR